MNAQVPLRGGEAVGRVETLPALESLVVYAIRQISGGTKGRTVLRRELGSAVGRDLALRVDDLIANLLELCKAHGRRPLMCHAPGCCCLGADEGCLAQLVASAASGEREDAMLLACLIVRADVAPGLTACAEQLGLTLLRGLGAARPADARLH